MRVALPGILADDGLCDTAKRDDKIIVDEAVQADRIRERYCASAGFTLIEILVALTVLSISLAVIFAGLSASLQGRRVSAEHQQAILLAESKLNAIGVEAPLEEGRTSGRFDRQFRWQAVVAPYSEERDEALEQGSMRPVQVIVTVSWGEANDERSVSLNSLRLLREERIPTR